MLVTVLRYIERLLIAGCTVVCCVRGTADVKCLLLLNHIKFISKVQRTFKEHEEKVQNALELKRKYAKIHYLVETN